MFGKRAGEFAAKRAQDLAQPSIDDAQVEQAISDMLAPLQREGENPGRIYDEMRDMMQAKVGIIKTKAELKKRLTTSSRSRNETLACSSGTSRKYNSGWHQALDLSIWPMCPWPRWPPSARGKPWRPHKDDFPTPEDDYWGKTLNIIWMKTVR